MRSGVSCVNKCSNYHSQIIHTDFCFIRQEFARELTGTVGSALTSQAENGQILMQS